MTDLKQEIRYTIDFKIYEIKRIESHCVCVRKKIDSQNFKMNHPYRTKNYAIDAMIKQLIELKE